MMSLLRLELYTRPRRRLFQRPRAIHLAEIWSGWIDLEAGLRVSAEIRSQAGKQLTFLGRWKACGGGLRGCGRNHGLSESGR